MGEHLPFATFLGQTGTTAGADNEVKPAPVPKTAAGKKRMAAGDSAEDVADNEKTAAPAKGKRPPKKQPKTEPARSDVPAKAKSPDKSASDEDAMGECLRKESAKLARSC